MALFLVVLMSIESFAAVVSDNDGSAFITKAEFDSLKNNFQSQIDSYNTNIDNKIDAAISAYLAGIKIEKTTTVAVLHNDWNNIEFINYEIVPEFKVPNYTWTVTASWHTYLSDVDKKEAVVGGYKQYNRTWSGNETNMRPLGNVIYGSEADFANNTNNNKKVAWGGCAARWVENWLFNKYGYGKCYNMTGNTNYRIYMDGPFSFGDSGYIKGKTMQQILPIKPRFQDGSGTNWDISPRNTSNDRQDLDYTYYEGYFDFINTLDNLSDGTQILHDHIFVNNGTTNFYLFNPNFNNTLNYCTYQTVSDSAVGNVTGATTFINGQRQTFDSSASDSSGAYATHYTTSYIGTIAWNYANSYIPMNGLIKKHYPANDIYQEQYNVNNSGALYLRELSWDGAEILGAPALTLENGLETCISVKDKTYEWEIEFDTISLTDASGTRTNQNEVDIYLSKVPFGDGTTTTNKIQMIVGTEKKDYVTTTNRKAKIKWEVTDEKTMVYMKCIPHFKSTDTQSESFFIKLNNSASNQISVTTKT